MSLEGGGKEGSTGGAWDNGEDTMGRGDYSHGHEQNPGASLPWREIYGEIHKYPQEGIDLTSCGKLDTLEKFCFS